LSDHVDLSTGVLVIGGGLAGTWAALTAAQHGADVILVDKGYCGTSGVTATAGVGHWYLPPEAREAEIAARSAAGGDLPDPAWMHATMEVVWRRLAELDPYYPWPVRDGRPNRATQVRGPEYLRLMRARVRRAGVTVLDHHPATELLARRDGAVAGASGLRLQEGGTWTCRAAAVILATGGTAFLSRLLGANNNTADGHLMAAEAGAGLAGMEFSCYYTVAAAHSTMTRSFPFMYGTYRDSDGEVLATEGPRATLPVIARALARGPVTVVLDQMPGPTRDRLRHVQPNFLLPLLRRGIDPFTDPFPVTLRGEGTIRGTGGIALTDRDCQAGVPGLYAAGDVASRQPIVGGASGGGSPNSAWCVASGTWSGQAAARRAQAESTRADTRPLGRAGLRPPGGRRRPLAPPEIGEIRRTISAELNAVDKNMFRTAAGLRRSLAVADDHWAQLADRAPVEAVAGATVTDRLRTRETAALAAAARWVLHAALTRQESRGMHQRADAPGRDPRFAGTVRTGGLDPVITTLDPARETAYETAYETERAS
jgi:succinate dehydrogenase/fumarate reductase flavoprotein subunit